MADAVRLFGQFKDEQGTQWKVNLHDADFSGTATEVLLSGEGFVLQYSGDNENRMQPIIGSALSFGIQVQNSTVLGQLELIETSEEGRFTCTVVRDPENTAVLFWSGVVLGDQVVTADEYFPILVKLRAVDDLGNLRNVLYKSGAVGYGGEATLAQHLNQCVLKLRHIQNIPWGDPLVWWANNFTATGISPLLDQISRVGVHHAAFYGLNDDGEAEFISTFEVLRQICLTLNCRLFQHEGAFWMVPVAIYGTFTGSAQWDFYSIDGAGNVSTATSVNLAKVINTDLLRMVGNEITHMPPLQEVKKVWQVRGDVPAISFTHYLNSIGGLFPPALLGTTVLDAGLAYALNDELKMQGEYRQAWAADGSLTGQDTIGTLFLKMQVKVGTLYLVNTVTFSSTQWASVSWLTGAANRRPFTVSDGAWQSTAGFFYYPVITAVNLSQERTQENPWLHFINLVLPAITSAQEGMEITVELDGRDYEGNAITNFEAATSYARLNLSVFRLHAASNQVQAVTYVASFDTESQTKVRQDLILGSTEFTAGIDGSLLNMTATPSEGVATFTSLARPTEPAQPIHQIAAAEILQGQKYATLIRRGRFFGDWISPLHFLILGTDKFLPFQTTYVANACETDIEAFKVAFNGMDMQTPSVQGTFTDVGAVGGSVSDTFTPALDEAVDNTGKQLAVVEGEVDTIGLGLTAVQDQVKVIYETFNPKGDDYGTTQVKYQQNKTDGMAMTLQQQQMNLASTTGNTQLLITESSAGTIQLKAQDEGTGSHLALYATSKSSTGGVVGINTNSPTATLHVAGSAKVQGTISLVTILAMATDQDLTPTEGQLTYNYDQNAWLLGMAGDEVRSMEDDWWVCKNQTGSTIAAGVPVYAAGTVGNSGRKLIAPMVADGTINSRYFLGVTAESIASGADGLVMDRGTIKGVNTSTFTDGDVLWVSQTAAGSLTATEPSSGMKIAAGFVISAASNGVLAVRNLGDEAAGGGGSAGNNFGTIAVAGQTDVVADQDEDTLTLAAGSNVVLSTDAGTDSVTIATSNTPSFTSVSVGSSGIVSVGNISTLGSIQASGNISAADGTFSGNANFQGTLTAGTAILTGIQFTGGGTTSIGIATGLPNQPTDLQITSNGNVTVLLDADVNESGQKFMVHDPSGTERFSVDDNGAATFNDAFSLPTADGTAGQVLATDGAGSVGWAAVAGGKSSTATGYMEIKSNSITQLFTGPTNGIYGADYTTGNNGATSYAHNGTAPTAGSSTISKYPYYVRGGLIDMHHDCSSISFTARLQDISQNAAGKSLWACIWHLAGGASESFTSGTWTAAAVGTGTIQATSANITLAKVVATASGLSISAGDSLWITFGWIDQPASTPDVNVNWSLNMNE